MLGVFIIPTGLGAAIGGHAGDASPAAKLIAKCCDALIVHPNVVNASDINEMTDNMLYVEGSILDRFLQGAIELQPVRTQNKVLVAANAPVQAETINAVSAARATIGLDAEIVELERPLRMISRLSDTQATGDVSGVDLLVQTVERFEFDALAVHTPIKVSREVALNYYRNGGINPWGGVEAKASRLIADAVCKPVAHAPLENTDPNDRELCDVFCRVVPPRIAAEAISNCFLHCVLKGLHRAPRIGNGISCCDITFLVSPYGCWGAPHEACRLNGIPVVSVRENTVRAMSKDIPEHVIVENYWEAAGWIMSMRAGVQPASVRTKFPSTVVRKT